MLEILAPAGNTECAVAALESGANAIYLGYSAFSARAGAENFDDEALKEILQKAHFAGAKVYLAMNTLVKEREIETFVKTLLRVWALGIDAVILQDIFLGKYIKETYPDVVLHLSTQAGVCSLSGARLAKEFGFSRVILARETPLDEIKKIAAEIETEVFVQGALCTAFSGQCYFSSFVGGNSGNRGRCKQPCRKKYRWNRAGFEEEAYALSLSDLSVGEDIERLIACGVVSFKIEGRMRRKEYVAAAVKYYRSLLEKATECEKAVALSDLKRAYNRGNYTKGLAFGQDKRFLSRAVQGHIGEKVGVVKVINASYFVESAFQPVVGDAFKILRDGKEVGGAFFAKRQGRGFTLSTKLRLKNGDGVFVTTDTQSLARVLAGGDKKPLSISLEFSVGKRAVASAYGVTVSSEFVLEQATSAALNEEELKRCFEKVDGLPFAVEFERIEINGRAFVAKSQLNAFRREFFKQVYAFYTQTKNQEYAFQPLPKAAFSGENSRLAVLSNGGFGNAEIAVYKPSDYQFPLPENFLSLRAEKYLYAPAFLTDSEIERVFTLVEEYGLDGVYAENYAVLYAAKTRKSKVFAGTGLNLTNSIAVQTVLEWDYVAYYALSKELSLAESKPLISGKAFALASGDIKLMDLCYCPFGKSCKGCDRREEYLLTDENGREFPVRRYEINGNCRFEVYNCAKLVGIGCNGAGRLIETTVTKRKEEAANAVTEESQKKIYAKYTSGHQRNGVL